MLQITTESPALVDGGHAFQATGLVHRARPGRGSAPFPTVVMLHGQGGSEDSMWVFERTLPAGWLVVAPRGIQADAQGGYAWRPRARDEWPTLHDLSHAAEAVVRFVAGLPAAHAADPDRVHLMGFSQGAAVAFAAAVAGGPSDSLASLVGFLPRPSDAEHPAESVWRRLAGHRIFAAAGRRDPYIPLESARADARLLEEAGAQLTYREYPTGHRLDRRGTRDLGTWWAGIAASLAP